MKSFKIKTKFIKVFIILKILILICSCSNSNEHKNIKNIDINSSINLNEKGLQRISCKKMSSTEINEEILYKYTTGDFEIEKQLNNAISYHDNGVISVLNLCTKSTNNVSCIYNDTQHEKKISFYESGQLREIIERKNRHYHGTQIIYWKNGKVQRQKKFEYGKQVGEDVSYFEDGSLMFKINYLDGKKDGLSVRYFSNGNIKDKSEYRMDKLIFTNSYDETGKLENSLKNKDLIIKSEYGEKITDIDGNIYKTILIGSQQWMTEDLKVTKYNDGTLIPHIENFDEWFNHFDGAWCKSLSNNSDFGNLYNFYTIEKKNICPQGWHVPSISEWNILIDYLGGKELAGGRLKEEGTSNWISPNKEASNSSLFSALPNGFLDYGKGRSSFKIMGLWWSSTRIGKHEANYTLMNYSNSFASTRKAVKINGMSIRCIKD